MKFMRFMYIIIQDLLHLCEGTESWGFFFLWRMYTLAADIFARHEEVVPFTQQRSDRHKLSAHIFGKTHPISA